MKKTKQKKSHKKTPQPPQTLWQQARRHILRTELIILYSIVVIVSGYIGLVNYEHRDDAEITYGVTFSTKYAKELGIDWRAAYLALLTEMDVNYFRIPVYWDEIQPEKNGELQLEEVEWMLDRAAENDAKIILAIGERVPRWPECHPPQWAKQQWPQDREAAELAMLEQVTDHFRNNSTIVMWQVQNEPLLSTFGECPLRSMEHISRTVSVVRSIDDTRPIMMTDSGELSTWTGLTDITDVLGVSMYRVTWNRFLGYFYYTLPPEYYSIKARAIDPFIDKIILSELQAEPWPPGKSITETSLSDQYKSMNPKRFQQNIDYAQRAGFTEIYLWGPEWWYYLKQKHNDPVMWDTAATYFLQQP